MSRTLVKVSEVVVASGPGTLAAVGLGSCVAVALYDPVARIGGMAHVLLPAPPRPVRPAAPEGRYATTAVPLLIGRLEQAGADRSRLVARLAGGSSMFASLAAPGSVSTGERNVVAVHRALAEAGIPVTGEAVGGERGRSVELDLATGRVQVSSVHDGSRDL